MRSPQPEHGENASAAACFFGLLELSRRPGRDAARVGSSRRYRFDDREVALRGRRGSCRAQIEIATDLEHYFAADRLLRQRKAALEGVVADHTDRSRNAVRVLVYYRQRLPREEPRRVASGRPDPRADISGGLLQGEGPDLASQRH